MCFDLKQNKSSHALHDDALSYVFVIPYLSEVDVYKRQVIGRVKTYEAIIKGDNIPEPGIPESFKVLLKELQSLGLDVRVLREDMTEVEIMENIDYGDTDMRSIIEGDSRGNDNEDYGSHGFSKQEFEGEELVDVEEDTDEDVFLDLDEDALDE